MTLISSQISGLKLLTFARLSRNFQPVRWKTADAPLTLNPLTMIARARDKAQLKPDEEEGPEDKPKTDKDIKKVERPTQRLSQLKEKYKSNPPALMEFFDDFKNWGESVVKTGREWRVDELRLKSNQDIHKLWFVLYKERNMLLTMLEESRTQIELFPNPERLDRVEQSMLNIEEVVKERNKAYFDLEVGNGETGIRPYVFRRDIFGIHGYTNCSEHLKPYGMSPEFRNLRGPGSGKYVSKFIQKYREMKVRKLTRKTLEQWLHVRQILRRFPDVNIDEVKALYPRVPVEYLRDNLDYFGLRDDIFLYGKKGKFIGAE